MRTIRTSEEVHFGKRPLCFCGWPNEADRPSYFSFKFPDEMSRPPHATARLYYRNGWTGVILWNGEIYFAEQILTFDAMIELARSRFTMNWALQDPIGRDYVD